VTSRGVSPLAQRRPAGGAGAAFACSDLSACSIADLGTKDHDLLDGLLDDDHSIYALLAGRSGGQTLKGGTAASEHLTLQSTDHATRGYVRAQDDLQLLSNILRDSAGNERVTLAAASPHVKATGDAKVTGHLGVVGDPQADYGMTYVEDRAAGVYSTYGLGIDIGAAPTQVFGTLVGVYGFTRFKGSGNLGTVRGLDFQAIIDSAATGTNLMADGVRMQVKTPASGPASVAITQGATIIGAPSMAVSTTRGLRVGDCGGASVTTVEGVKIDDQTLGAARRCLEVGPSTPYLRVYGGWTPVANQTPIDVSEGSPAVRRNLRIMDPGVGGANFAGGERVCILV
jgi:hypothetical protein